MTTKAIPVKFGRCEETFTFEQFKALPNNDPHLDHELYAYEEKFDGHRYAWEIQPGGGSSNVLITRSISKTTRRQVERQDKYPALRTWFHPEVKGCIFDGEMSAGAGGTSNETATAVSKGVGDLIIFDIIKTSQQYMELCPFKERRELLERLFKRVKFPENVKLVSQSIDARRLLRAVVAQRGEGIIGKKWTSDYGTDWFRVKEAKTHDCVVVGYEMSTEGKYAEHGWIKGVKIAQWFRTNDASMINAGLYHGVRNEGKVTYVLRRVGQISGFDEETRADITDNQQKYMNRPVEILAQFRLPSGYFRHPRFSRWRDDKPGHECKAL